MMMIKMNRLQLSLNPNAGAKKISSKGIEHPIIIQMICFPIVYQFIIQYIIP